ncbi:ATP-grasp fold amidoligase family protein [Aliarcobacter butzleri]
MKNLIKKLKYYLRYLLIPDEKYIKYKFKKRFGYELNINNPRTINEKIQWLKLFDRSPLHTQCADKYLVREYIKNIIGEKYLIPLVFNTFEVKDINIENLPNYPVVIKVNHARGVFLVRDKINIDLKNIQKKLKNELNTNFYYRTREWQYKNIKPRIVVEKMLLDEKENLPIDYKIWCMNGKVIMFQVDTGSQGNHIITFFDKNWKAFSFKKNYPTDQNVKIPNNLEEMTIIAEKLSKDFLFVRVDLYNINNKVYFGELTFHPESGFGKFYPENADLELGEKLNLGIINE